MDTTKEPHHTIAINRTYITIFRKGRKKGAQLTTPRVADGLELVDEVNDDDLADLHARSARTRNDRLATLDISRC